MDRLTDGWTFVIVELLLRLKMVIKFNHIPNYARLLLRRLWDRDQCEYEYSTFTYIYMFVWSNIPYVCYFIINHYHRKVSYGKLGNIHLKIGN